MPIILVRAPVDMYYTEILGDIDPRILEILRLNEGWKQKDWDFVKSLKRRKKYLITINLMVQDVLAIICSSFDFQVAQSTVYLSNPEGAHYLLYILQKLVSPSSYAFYDADKDVTKRTLATETYSLHRGSVKHVTTETETDERYWWLPAKQETEGKIIKPSRGTTTEGIDAEPWQEGKSISQVPMEEAEIDQRVKEVAKPEGATEIGKASEEEEVSPSESKPTIESKSKEITEQKEESADKINEQSDASDITKEQSDTSGKIKEQSDTSGEIKEQSDSSGEIKEQSDTSGEIKEQSDTSGEINEQSDASEKIKEQSDASEKIKEQSDASEKIKEQSDAPGKIDEQSEAPGKIDEQSEAPDKITKQPEETGEPIKTKEEKEVIEQKELPIEKTPLLDKTDETVKSNVPTSDRVETLDKSDKTVTEADKQEEDVEPIKERVKAEGKSKSFKEKSQMKVAELGHEELFTAVSDLESKHEHHLFRGFIKKVSVTDQPGGQDRDKEGAKETSDYPKSKQEPERTSESPEVSDSKTSKSKRTELKEITPNEKTPSESVENKEDSLVETSGKHVVQQEGTSESTESKKEDTQITTKDVPPTTQVAAHIKTFEESPLEKERKLSEARDEGEIEVDQDLETPEERVDNQESVMLIESLKLTSGKVKAWTLTKTEHVQVVKSAEPQSESIKPTECIKPTHDTEVGSLEARESQATKLSDLTKSISTNVLPHGSSYVGKVDVIIRESDTDQRSMTSDKDPSESSPYEAVASTSRTVKPVSDRQKSETKKPMAEDGVKGRRPKSLRRKRYVRRRGKYDINEVIDRLSRAFTGNILSKPKRSTSESSDETKKSTVGTSEFQVGYVFCEPPTKSIFDFVINLPRTLSEKIMNFMRRSYQSPTPSDRSESFHPVPSTSKESDSECDDFLCEPSTSTSCPEVALKRPKSDILFKPRIPFKKATSTSSFRVKQKLQQPQEKSDRVSSEFFGGTLRLKKKGSSTESSHHYERERGTPAESSSSPGSSRVQSDLPEFALQSSSSEYDRPSTSTSSNGS